MVLVLRFLEHAPVEVQPGQLAVDEALGIVGPDIRRHGWPGPRHGAAAVAAVAAPATTVGSSISAMSGAYLSLHIDPTGRPAIVVRGDAADRRAEVSFAAAPAPRFKSPPVSASDGRWQRRWSGARRRWSSRDAASRTAAGRARQAKQQVVLNRLRHGELPLGEQAREQRAQQRLLGRADFDRRDRPQPACEVGQRRRPTAPAPPRAASSTGRAASAAAFRVCSSASGGAAVGVVDRQRRARAAVGAQRRARRSRSAPLPPGPEMQQVRLAAARAAPQREPALRPFRVFAPATRARPRWTGAARKSGP